MYNNIFNHGVLFIQQSVIYDCRGYNCIQLPIVSIPIIARLELIRDKRVFFGRDGVPRVVVGEEKSDIAGRSDLYSNIVSRP